MYVGPIYLDSYNGLQYATAAGALISLALGAFIVLSAALRAALKHWFASSFVLALSGVFIPTSVALTLIVGPWVEQIWSWVVYQWLNGGGYGGYYYGYGYTIPWRPHLSTLFYGISIGHSLAIGGAAVAMILLGIATHLLIPLGAGGSVFLEADEALD